MNNLYIGVRGKKKGLVFRSDEIPTREKYGRYFDNVIGPFRNIENVAQYCREWRLSPKLFDPRSFRTITLGAGPKRGIIGCPKGYWSDKIKKCRVGTRLQSILIPEGGEECPVGGIEIRKRRKRNPGEEYHNRKFREHLKQTEIWKLGSPSYLIELGRAYAHLESARDSVREEV